MISFNSAEDMKDERERKRDLADGTIQGNFLYHLTWLCEKLASAQVAVTYERWIFLYDSPCQISALMGTSRHVSVLSKVIELFPNAVSNP